jgi:GxxExxY protein
MNTDYKHKELTEKIIQGFYEVYNELGFGFLESVYEKSLILVLRAYGLIAENRFPIEVNFRNQVVGEYRADLIIEDKIIIELKAVRTLLPEHEAQLLNYLKATKYEIGLLLNFGNRPQIKRLIFDNGRKRSHRQT